jgi:hypothetical protein
MRVLTMLLVALAIVGHATDAMAAGKMRLAQTSTVTNCMNSCNSQAASCQSSCVIPGTPPTGAATSTSNANTNESCLSSCSTTQLSCQTSCARSSPSQ